MRNLRYISLYIVLLCTVFTTVLTAQLDCVSQPAPENDLCANATELMGPVINTTCCASIENVTQCSNMGSGVWYTYSQLYNGSEIHITNLGIFGPISVEVYSGNCGNLSLIKKSDCAGFQIRKILIPSCYNTIYIHVASTREGCGKFLISVEDKDECMFAEDCEDIKPELIFEPVSDGQRECISSCMQFACDGICTEQGVWFQLNTDNDATAIQLSIENAGFEPMISVNRGITCDDTEDLIFCQQMTQGEFININVIPNFTYFIQISVGTGEPSPFDLCITSVKDFIDCSNGTLTVSRPMFPGENPEGPYCPGETVVFCYDVEYYVDIPGQGNNCQWLQGIIPVIGGGWDTSVNSLVDQAPPTWEWLDEGSVDYNVQSDVLSIGTNPLGSLTLEYGSGGVNAGDLLPGGWWHTSPGGQGCLNDGDPDNMFGVEYPCGQVMSFSHCFQLTAKSIQNIQDCNNGFFTDLSVTIFNLADGETGCYNDVTCSGDTPVVFNGSLDCSQLIEISAENKEICSGDFVEIPVSISNGFEKAVIIEVIDEGNTTGAQGWTFGSGSGIIPDQITNLGNEIETILYRATLSDSSFLCEAPFIEFELQVHPPLPFEVMDSLRICKGDSIEYIAPQGYEAYEWYDPAGQLVSSDREVMLKDSGNYTIIVYEGLCKAIGTIKLNHSLPFPSGLTVNKIRVCDDWVGSYPTMVDLTEYQYTFVQGVWRDENNNEVIDPTSLDFTGAAPGSYRYSIETTNAIFPCPDTTFWMEIIVEDCECPVVDLLPLPDMCSGDNILMLSDYEISSQPGHWELVDGPVGTSIELSGGMLTLNDNTLGGDYTLSFQLNDISSTPACNDEVMTVLTIIEKPSAEIMDRTTACNASTGFNPEIIDLDDLFVSGAGGVWTNTAGLMIETDNSVSFTGVAPGDYEFIYTTNTAQAPCENIQRTSTITVEDCSCPQLDINLPGTLCQEEATYDLDDLIINADPGSWTLDPGAAVNPPVLDSDNRLLIENNTTPGNYSLTYNLNDPNIHPDCSASIEIVLLIQEAPQLQLVPELEACNGYDGAYEQVFALEDLILDGQTGGEWVIDNASIALTVDSIYFSGVEPGSYMLSYTTNNAVQPCEDISGAININVNECACPLIETLPFPDLCNTSNTIDLSNYVNTNAPGEWLINGMTTVQGLLIVNGNTLELSETVAGGDYELSYVLEDLGYDENCTALASTAFTIYETPGATIISDTTVCNKDIGTGPDRLDLDAMLVSASAGEWSAEDNTITIGVGNEIVFTGFTPGDYTFIYKTNTAIAPCEDQTYEVKVTVVDCSCPVLDIEAPAAACNTGEIIDLNNYLENPTGAPGSWTVSGPGLTGDQAILKSDTLSPGIYEIEFRWDDDPIGDCNDRVNTQLIINEQPEINVLPAFSVCNVVEAETPHCIDLSSFVSGSQGIWQAPAGYTGDFSDITNVCFDGLPGGNDYEFTYTTNVAEDPCVDRQAITVITVEDCVCPVLGILDPGPLCNENDGLLLADMEVENIAPGQWDFISGPEVVDISSGFFDANNLTAGIYTLEYILDEQVQSHCEQAMQINVEIMEIYHTGLGVDMEVCESQDTTYVLFPMLQGADEGGQWRDRSSQPVAGALDQGMVNTADLVAGQYEFEYYFDNSMPCEDDSTMIVLTVHEEPEVYAGEDQVLNCAADQVMIGSDSNILNSDIIYNWYDASGDMLAADSEPVMMVTEPGTYFLESRNTKTQCTGMDQVQVAQDTEMPAFEAGVVSGPCDFDSPGVIEIWNITGVHGTVQFSIDDGENWTTQPFFEDLPEGSYTILMEDERGCRTEQLGLVINNSQPFGLSAGNDQTVQYGEEYHTLSPQLSVDLSAIETVIWEQDGEVICEGSVEECLILDVDPFDINTYCVTVIDYNGCEAMDCITLKEELEPRIYLPNVFTPDSYDINNRVFVQTDQNIKIVNEFRIYDRWGNLVFEAEPGHPPNDPQYGWNGFFKGRFALEGVYVYVVNVTDVLEEDHTVGGDVMLVR